MSRPTIIAGNWKMFKTASETQSYMQSMSPQVVGRDEKIYIGVPFTAIRCAAEAAAGSDIQVGAQNMHDAKDGAFTGEISADMLKDAGATFVILGHSERRHLFNESSGFVNTKVLRALQSGLQPVLCVGETIDQRNSGDTHAVLRCQLTESLQAVDGEQLASMVVAYEPVWAIGTGETATPEMAQEAHAFCRSVLSDAWGSDVAEQVPLLYGGSVKPDNAAVLLNQPDIDGVLVGGASLDADSFAKIVKSQTQEVS